MSALRSLRESRKTNQSLKKNLEKLSSGLRINCAADDAAGLSISERMRAKITELDRCQNNVSEGLALAKTADAALTEMNEMLRRAHYLCVEAENGTYSEQEQAEISDELNQLFSEIDRISASSNYNSIQLFRGETTPLEYRYEYEEIFETLGPDQLTIWGSMEFVKTEDFDRAETAKAAKAVFQLDDSIDLTDKTTLEGKSIKIGGSTFTFASNPPSTAGTGIINLDQYKTAKEALLALKRASSSISDITVTDSGEVTLTATLSSLTTSVMVDGKPVKFTVPQGDGERRNGLVVQNVTGGQSLSQVDGAGVTNNQPAYTDSTVKFSLDKIVGKLTKDQADQLNQNSLVIRTRSGQENSDIYTTIQLSGFQENMTKDQVAALLVNSIQGASNSTSTYTAVYNTSGHLEITAQRNGYDGPLNASIYELKPSTTTTEYDNAHKWTSQKLNISVSSTPGTMETGPTLTISVPQQMTPPFSFKIGAYDYLYYDSTKTPLTSPDYPSTSFSPHPDYKIDTSKIGDVRSDLLKRIAERANGMSNVDSVTINGNTVVVKGNVNSTLSLSASGTTITVTPYKTVSTGTQSKYVLTNGSSYTFSQEVSSVFDLGSNISALAGKGFSFDGTRLEFTNGSGAGLDSSYADVDISACQTAAQVAQAVAAKLGNTYTVTADASGKMTISRKWTSSNYLSVTDGTEGIVKGGAVQFSGGQNVGHSQKVLDFSSINEDNLDTLLGKGFRINCATCAGEYINVFFCWENDGTMPKSFQRLDKTTGEMRTIHNIPVELSKVTSGNKIVEDIVKQVRPSLNHYTDVAVGNPPTTLVAMEKRFGDVKDPAGKLYLGQIQTGLETNFTYKVSLKEVPVIEGGPAVVLPKGDIKIYVGSEMDGQYIPIRLPYVDLPHLQLNPPEVVNLNAEDQDAADWLERVDHANIAISEARGTIGADYNRLEHAYRELGVADEELTDAESRIRDADMAELMMENVKMQILSQSQQGMMAQANSYPEQVLQLLQ